MERHEYALRPCELHQPDGREWCMGCNPEYYRAKYGVTLVADEIPLDPDEPPPPPPEPPAAPLPELPSGTGWTANEVADRLLPQGTIRTRFDVVRRRTQELENPMRLLIVIGVREGMTGADAQVYALHPNGLWREALARWEAGEVWPFFGILARSNDPETSKAAWHNLRPDTDRHMIIGFFARTWNA